MIVRHLHTVHELLAVLAQPTAEMTTLRALLTLPDGRYPARRTWERRLVALPVTLPGQIGCLGHYLVALLQPWAASRRAAAVDSTVLRATGGVWHKKDCEAGVVLHTSIDTEAHWTKSGWHGWVYGWKLHLATTVAAVWLPLAAELTSASVADNEIAPQVQAVCDRADRVLVTSQYGGYPHSGDGVEVRRKLRSTAIKNFNGSSRPSSTCGARCRPKG